MRVLFIGDIMGQSGRKMLAKHLPSLKEKGQVDICIANGENMAGGFGMTHKSYAEVTQCGVDVVTGGNHSFDKPEGREILVDEPYALRPANYPPGAPGKGHVLYSNTKGQKLGVINIMGRSFMDPIDCPFRCVDKLIEELKEQTPFIFVDFHAEASSEKVAMAWHLDGRTSMMVGTHTHVPTGDERIFPDGMAFISDAGMTGPYDSVIGVKKEIILQRFIHKVGRKFEVAMADPWLCGLLVEIGEDAKATRLQRIRIIDAEPESHPENTKFI